MEATLSLNLHFQNLPDQQPSPNNKKLVDLTGHSHSTKKQDNHHFRVNLINFKENENETIR